MVSFFILVNSSDQMYEEWIFKSFLLCESNLRYASVISSYFFGSCFSI